MQPWWFISDDEWSRVEPILLKDRLPKPKRSGRRVKVNLKNMAEAALHHHFANLANGYQCFGWNELPSSFGVAASSANCYYRRWLQSGQWFEFWDTLVEIRRGSEGPKPCASPMSKLTKELERAYSFFNWHFMGNALPLDVIIECSAKDSDVRGRFRADVEPKTNSKALILRVNISPHSPPSAMEICHTVLHEMVHLRNHVIGLRDCARAQYHNRHFRDSAQLFGLKGVGRNNHTRAHGSIRTSHLGKVGDRCNRSSNFALAALHKRTPLA